MVVGKKIPRLRSLFGRMWARVPLVVRAILVGFLVFAIAGSITLTAVLVLVPAPWSIAVMAAVLWVYVRYFSGSWGPSSTRRARRLYFRRTRLSAHNWKWSLLAAACAVVVLEASLVVIFRVFEFPADTWALGFDLGAAPAWQAWLFVLMASLVAGITEEVGFRGYMQVPLERRYGAPAGIAIVALMFVVAHLNQAWVAPPILVGLFTMGVLWGMLAQSSGSLLPAIISHVAADVINFSYWWTDLAGTFSYRTISDTGLDAHFFVWTLALLASLTLFFWAVRRINPARPLVL